MVTTVSVGFSVGVGVNSRVEVVDSFVELVGAGVGAGVTLFEDVFPAGVLVGTEPGAVKPVGTTPGGGRMPLGTEGFGVGIPVPFAPGGGRMPGIERVGRRPPRRPSELEVGLDVFEPPVGRRPPTIPPRRPPELEVGAGDAPGEVPGAPLGGRIPPTIPPSRPPELEVGAGAPGEVPGAPLGGRIPFTRPPRRPSDVGEGDAPGEVPC